jgi:Lon protease-like protein
MHLETEKGLLLLASSPISLAYVGRLLRITESQDPQENQCLILEQEAERLRVREEFCKMLSFEQAWLVFLQLTPMTATCTRPRQP